MSLLKLSSLERDIQAENEGEWVPVKKWFGLDPDDPNGFTELPNLKFKVRSGNYQPYKIARQKAAERFEEMKTDYPDGIPDDLAESEAGKLIAEHLLLGWEGLDVEYTPEVAIAALKKPAASVHRNMVLFCVSKVGRRKAEFVETAAKNSSGQSKSR